LLDFSLNIVLYSMIIYLSNLYISGSQTFLAKGHKQNSQKSWATQLWRLKLSYSFINIKQGRHCIKKTERLHRSNLKFLKNVHTVRVSVTVISQLGNEWCAIFFIF